MNESQLWNKLEKALQNADMTRHEDRTRRFIPDVSFGLQRVNGWIELKAYPRWPSDGVPKFRNFHPGQKNWLVKRGRAGGHCFVLVAVDKEIFLFGWWQVHMLGVWNGTQMWHLSLTSAAHRIPGDLASIVTAKRTEKSLILPAKFVSGRSDVATWRPKRLAV